MSNVVDLRDAGALDSQGGTHTQPSPFPQESELYFRAVERPLFWRAASVEKKAYTMPYELVDTHKMLLRRGNGSIGEDVAVQLAVVGKGYQLVQNKPLFQSIEEQFIKALSDQELAGVLVRDHMSYYGRICMREYIFPNMCCPSPTRGDIAFRTIVKNGFGGSSIVLYSGAISAFCANGMISGRYDCMYARHTKSMRITDITSRVRRSIDVFYKNAETWHEWYGKTITDGEAKAFFEDSYSEALAKKLYRQWSIEAQAHGPNMWALYNVLTYYASHNEGDFVTRNTGVDHVAVTLLKREEQVQSAVASNQWTRLLAA